MKVSPNELKIEVISQKDNVGVFAFDPLPTGFGHTLGNALRRVLYSSIEGAAITQVRIPNVKHQFTTIEGVKEDVVELTLNLKNIRFKKHGNEPVVCTLEKTGPGKVTAGDIKCPSEVEVISKEDHIATIADGKTPFKMELIVESGFGYSPSEERETSKVGVLLLDALFSPVLSAIYEVEPTRFESITNLDKLTVTVETDGSVTPESAVLDAAKILSDFFARVTVWDEDAEVEEEIEKVEVVASEEILVDDLPLPTRTINALKKAHILSLNAIAEKNPEELADIKNLGEKSVEEIEKLLVEEGLR